MQIRISSPTAAAAFVLTDLLGERGVTASPLADGTWEVVTTLNGRGQETLSIVLSAARDWLRTCALPSTQVTIGAQTHSIAAESPAAPAVTQSAT